MKKMLFIFLAIFLYSCSTDAPKEDEVKEMVKLWYMQQSSAEGAGTWDVNGVTVLSVKKDDKQKDIFKTVSLVSGKHRSAASGEPKGDENFSDTLRMYLRWNGAKWVTANE